MGCSGAESCAFGQHIGAGFCDGCSLRQCFGCSQRIGRCEKGNEEEECLELHIGAGRVLDRDRVFEKSLVVESAWVENNCVSGMAAGMARKWLGHEGPIYLELIEV